jgi:tetratricopeptide (TPR) repeat protein
VFRVIYLLLGYLIFGGLKKISVTFFVFFLFFFSIAQKSEYKQNFQQGNKYLLKENYPQALESFMKAYRLDSSNANINFKVGYCYYALVDQRDKAEIFLERAVKDVTKKYKETDADILQAPYYAYFYYAEALHYNHKLELAAKMFGKYEDFLEEGAVGVDSIKMEYHENMLVFAKKDLETAGSITITNLGENINTAAAEYAPVIDGEEKLLIFTYRGEQTTGADQGIKTEEGKFFEDIFFSERNADGSWSKAGPLPGINTNGHDATVNLTFDGSTLLVYKDDNGDGNLYYTERNGSDWGQLQKFGPQINTTHWEPSACFSLDKNTLYFVSDRPGGVGGRDIYRCRKLPNGEWSKAENLGPHINTPADEEGPFLHANGTDFFFSSQGHHSIGGFDVLLAELKDDGTFSTPVHLSYPINTPEDDIFYFVSSDEKRAYYASDKKSAQAKGQADIYVITIEGIESCALLKGAFIPAKGSSLPDKLSVRVFTPDGKLVGIYVPRKSGDFVAILKAGQDYVFSWEKDGEVLRKDNVTVKREDVYTETHLQLELNPFVFAGPPEVVVSQRKLDVKVVLKQSDGTFLPLSDASVVFQKAGQNTVTLKTDAEGFCRDILLDQNAEYSFVVTKGEFSPRQFIVNASEWKDNKTEMTIELSAPGLVSQKISGGVKLNFNYNVTQAEQDVETRQFMENLLQQIKSGKKLKVKLVGSASKVPTTRFGGSNYKLAMQRAVDFKESILKYLKENDIDISSLRFELKASVNGPAYKNDAQINREEYKKYQYINAQLAEDNLL